MQAPSNKVGFVLIFVVLCVSSTVFFSKIPIGGLKALENVDLTIARNTSAEGTETDADADGLTDWQESLYNADPRVADTDGDGTNDGDEVAVRRNPAVAGPNDPLLTTRDYFQTDVNLQGYATGTPTDKMSVELFAQYLNLKQSSQLTPEKQEELVAQIAQKTLGSLDLKDHFTATDLKLTGSSVESLETYGTEFAQTSLSNLRLLDSYSYLSDEAYLSQIVGAYKTYAFDMASLSVPDVAKDVHLQIVNRIYRTAEMFDFLAGEGQDPVSAMVAIGVHQSNGSDEHLYTSLASYFRNNDILFDDTTAARFWKYYER